MTEATPLSPFAVSICVCICALGTHAYVMMYRVVREEKERDDVQERSLRGKTKYAVRVIHGIEFSVER